MRTICLASIWFVSAATAVAQYNLGDCTITVVDEMGHPIAGAQVHCVSWHYGPRTTPLQPDEHGVTDAQGRVTFNNKSVGQSFARVVHGKLGGWFRVHDTEGEKTHGTVTPALGRTMKGTLKDEVGAPIAGALVLMDGCLPIGETDSEGAFSLPNIGAGNPHSVGFYKEGFEWKTESLFHITGPLDVRLRKGFSVDVIVVGPDNKPVAGAHAFVNQQNAELKTDSDGKATIVGVAANEKLGVSVWAAIDEKGHSGSHTIVLSEPPDGPIVIHLEYVPPTPRPVLRGRVVRADTGTPVTAQMLSGYDQYSPTGNPGATDKDGQFLIDNYSGGTYWISARPINPVLYVQGGPVQVDFNKLPEDELVLTVAEGCCIRGVALREDGTPVPDAWLQIEPWSGFVTMVQTRKDGRFTFANLDGVGVTYTISAQDEFGRRSSVSVGPMKKGEVREGVELRVPAMGKPHKLRVIVRDPRGEPLPNVQLSFTYEGKPVSIPSVPVTDDAGRIELNVVEGGPIKVSAWTRISAGVGERTQDVQQFLKISQNETFDLDATKDTDVELVMEHQMRSVLAGRVVDDSGNGVRAQLSIVSGDDRRDSTTSWDEGSFLFQRTPTPPYLLEVTEQGYRPRVFVIDEAFQSSGDPINVTLKPGPFAVGESVWSAVTGKPATEEAVNALPFAAYVRKNEARYYHEAKPRPAPPVDATPPRQLIAPRLRFVDAAGKPVERVMVQPLQSMAAPLVAAYKNVPGYQPAPTTSEDGIYRLTDPMAPNGSIVWSEESGRVLVHMLEWTTDPNAVVDVELRPAAIVELRVRTADGLPATETPVCLPDLAWDRGDNTKPYLIGTTDAEGILRIERVAPGVHAFAVGAFGSTCRLVAFRVKDGETKLAEISLVTDSSDSEWLLQEMRIASEARANDADPIVQRVSRLDEKQRGALASFARNQLDLFVDVPRTVRAREKERHFLTRLLRALHDRESTPIFQRAIRADARSTYKEGWPEQSSLVAMARAIAEFDGDTAVPFFTEVALNESLSERARIGALSALGHIASPTSAAAYKAVRDALRAKPGAPPEKESYTHAERMAESVYFYRVALTWNYDNSPAPSMFSMGHVDAKVSEDFREGTVYVGSQHGGATYKLVRVDDEWLVTQLENEWMT